MSDATKLSLFWFFYFGGVGIYFPYFSLYLRENAALDGTQVGLVLAIVPLVGALLQPLWGQLADRTGARGRVLALTTTGAALGFYGLGWAQSFAALLLASALLAGFATPIIPLISSVSLAVLREGGAQAFGRTRVWGTLGFLLLVVAFPYGLDLYQRAHAIAAVPGGPSEPALAIMFPIIAVFTLAAAAISLTFPRDGAIALRAQPREWRLLLRHPPMRRLVAYTMLAYLFLQGPMAFFPVYVTNRGGSIDTVGQMWVVMLLLEIPLIAYAGASVRRIGAQGLFQLGVFLAGVRWLVCGFSDNLAVIFPIQTVHAVAVAGLALGAPLYLDAIVPERLRSTGQSILVVGVGLGGVVSTTATGWLLDNVGIDAPYLIGGAGAVLLGLGGRRLLPPPQRLVLDDAA